uniref:Uncharacterized protein n=1 Tax=Myotis myotis TaxID=51298 RepID=A0A7J7SC34_MYOMY|nr:hypothetical protein mMyoMyo1_009526 [Myotis myotis]
MAKASFLPAYRMKEVGLLEPKNLGRIILDKVPGMGRGTKCRRRSLGLGGWRLAPGGFCLTSVIPLPLSTPLGMHVPVTGVKWLYLLCPFVLIFGREVKGLTVCGTETRSGGTFTMPSCAEQLDRLRNVTLGLRGGLLLWRSDSLPPTLPVPRPRSGRPASR